MLLVSKKKIRNSHAFCRDNKASIWGKNAVHCFVFYCFLELLLRNYLFKNAWLRPILFLDSNRPCQGLLFPHSHIKTAQKFFSISRHRPLNFGIKQASSFSARQIQYFRKLLLPTFTKKCSLIYLRMTLSKCLLV